MRELEDSHWWYRALRAAVLRRIGAAGRVLDAGCGTGGMLSALSGRFAAGVDLSGTALSLAATRGISRLVRASICDLPFRNGFFDAVLALDVLSHKGVPDESAALAECARVTRPGGLVVLHLPAYRWLASAHDLAVHGGRRYTRGEVSGLVRGAGLEIVELTGRNIPLLPFAAARRFLYPLPGPGRSSLAPAPRWLGAAARWFLRKEDEVLARIPLPLGLSCLCLARKPRVGEGAAA